MNGEFSSSMMASPFPNSDEMKDKEDLKNKQRICAPLILRKSFKNGEYTIINKQDNSIRKDKFSISFALYFI